MVSLYPKCNKINMHTYRLRRAQFSGGKRRQQGPKHWVLREGLREAYAKASTHSAHALWVSYSKNDPERKKQLDRQCGSYQATLSRSRQISFVGNELPFHRSYFTAWSTTHGPCWFSIVVWIRKNQSQNTMNWELLVFTYHVIKPKNRNHSLNKVTNKGCDRW